jgi:hypothetical protein
MSTIAETIKNKPTIEPTKENSFIYVHISQRTGSILQLVDDSYMLSRTVEHLYALSSDWVAK